MLKQTVIHIADRHTTLYYLTDPAPAGPLPFSSAEAYQDLQTRLASAGSIAYTDVSGKTGQLLRRLERAYERDDFWHRYLSTDDYEAYPNCAWDFNIPVQATLNLRVECQPVAPFPCKVSPVPRVLLFPSGWSVWIDLLLSGDHRLEDLSSILQMLFRRRVFCIVDPNVPATPSAQAKVLTLAETLRALSRGVRIDAFGGLSTLDSSTPDQLVVTTVLTQHDELLSCESLQPQKKQLLSSIVHPGRGLAPSIAELPTMIRKLDEPVNFVVADTFGRFIWMARLHRSKGRNRAHLRCYHNNTFRSFVLAWHQLGLLQSLIRPEQPLTPKLKTLAKTVESRLVYPGYNSVSLRYFLEEGNVKRTLKAIQERLDPIKHGHNPC